MANLCKLYLSNIPQGYTWFFSLGYVIHEGLNPYGYWEQASIYPVEGDQWFRAISEGPFTFNLDPVWARRELEGWPASGGFFQAIIIRTLPNGDTADTTIKGPSIDPGAGKLYMWNVGSNSIAEITLPPNGGNGGPPPSPQPGGINVGMVAGVVGLGLLLGWALSRRKT
jgi:hypothetical protein